MQVVSRLWNHPRYWIDTRCSAPCFYRLALLVLLGSIALSLRGMNTGVHIMGRDEYDPVNVNVTSGVSVSGHVDVRQR